MESHLKCVCHTRDNRRGINNHVISYAATDFPIASRFEHEDHVTLTDLFEDVIRAIFNFKGSGKPNLSGVATLAIDCGYTRIAILSWWLAT